MSHLLSPITQWNRKQVILILVAGLGYFVDIYDLVLFSVIRIPSLQGIGLQGEELTSKGIALLNWQMTGLLTGGLIWGLLGDLKGRVSVLFGSIALYSLANIANGFVTNYETYALIRLLAGIGLAGELGAGITLVSESLSKESRGLGTMIVATLGLLGAVVAGSVGNMFAWQTAYFVGGGMGLLLLLMRIGVFESGMFQNARKKKQVLFGDIRLLFNSRDRFFRYLHCIIIGIPIWFVVAILITLAPEFGRILGITEALSAGTAIMYCYVGLAIGDFGSGLLSQVFRTRKKVVLAFIFLTYGLIWVYFSGGLTSSRSFYLLCLFLGTATGYWAVFVTVASEQFGTNIRATVTTTVPNFVRGSVVPVNLLFLYLSQSLGMVQSALIVGSLVSGLAVFSAFKLKETFGKDLDYIEQN